jgi:hypothetical protein
VTVVVLGLAVLGFLSLVSLVAHLTGYIVKVGLLVALIAVVVMAVGRRH